MRNALTGLDYYQAAMLHTLRALPDDESRFLFDLAHRLGKLRHQQQHADNVVQFSHTKVTPEVSK